MKNVRRKPGRAFEWLLVIFLAAVACTLATAQSQSGGTISPSQPEQSKGLDAVRRVMALTPPDELVRQAVNNELNEKQEGHYLYTDWRKTPEGTTTKQIVETSDGLVARLIAINDHPLSAEQESAEQARLRKLLEDPEIQKQKKKEQEQDADRVTRMFRQLPDAFKYTYGKVEPGPSGSLIQLKFVPNPKYDPPSREMSVFKAMSGQLWISVPQIRLAKIEATLFRDVNFGWGILGHLDKGGHFFVSQSEINPHHWEATDMNIQFTGKALLFKTINMRQVEKLSDFHRVPDNLTLTQAIELLNKNGKQVAESVSNK